MAFPLAALGTGLGQFADYWQREQQNRRQQAMDQLRIDQYQRALQDQQTEDQGWAALSGGAPYAGLAGLSGSLGGDGQLAPVPTSANLGAGSRYSADDLVAQGLNPALAPFVGRESGGNPNIGYGGTDLSNAPRDQYGFPQWSGKMGPQGISHAAGILQDQPGTWDPVARDLGVSDFSTPSQIKVNNEIYAREGTRPWGGTQGPPSRGPRSTLDQEPATQQLNADLDASTRAVGSTIPPAAVGQVGMMAMASRIDQVMPNAPGHVKFQVLERMQKIMAPQERQRFDLWKIQHDDAIQAARDEQQHRYRLEEQAGTGEIKETSEGGLVRIGRGSNVATPITDQSGQPIRGRAKTGTPQNIVAFDKDGKQVFEGSAVFDPSTKSWSNAATGAAIPADRVESVSKGATAGGGRAGAQVQRQVIAGREIQSDLENVANLPITTNRGVFGGRQQGPGLLDALKENMAETVTSEDAELTNAALSGLERELSIVASPVYGGKWAAQSFNALSLKEGQTNLVKLYNLARMRQTVDNALEGVINTDWVGKEQKAFAQQIRESVEKAIPWTPADVLAFRASKQAPQETFRSFIDKNKVGGASERGAATGPATGGLPTIKSQDEYDKLPPGTKFQDTEGKTYTKPAAGPPT